MKNDKEITGSYVESAIGHLPKTENVDPEVLLRDHRLCKNVGLRRPRKVPVRVSGRRVLVWAVDGTKGSPQSSAQALCT